MSAGLIIRDPSGNVLIDRNTRLGRVLGSVEVSGDGSMQVPGFATGSGFAKVMPMVDAAGPGSSPFPPEAAVSGNTLSWTYPVSGNRGPAIIVFEVR